MRVEWCRSREDSLAPRYSRVVIPEGLIVRRASSAGAVRRLLIGPSNSAGQGYAWAMAAERVLPDVSGTSYRCVVDENPSAVHQFNTADLTFDADFSRALQTHIVSTYTHVLLESNWPIIQGNGESAENNVAMLRNAGLNVALVAHGSDVRVPSQHAARQRWNQFQHFDVKTVDRMEQRALDNVAHYSSFGGEVFVSTAGLLDFLPRATWLPVVLDPQQWQSERPALSDDVVTVLFAPSSGQKGQQWIDPVLTDLEASGVVRYRRLAGIAHDQMRSTLAVVDVVVDQMGADDYGVAAVEAMAAGRLVVGMVSDRVRQHVRDTTGLALPILQADPSTLREVMVDIAARPQEYAERAARGPAFVDAVHDGRRAATVLAPFLDRPVRVLPPAARRATTPMKTPQATGERRPHVLYVAWGFPPSRGSGVYRALATANALYRAGFDVTVLTATHETFERYTGSDESLEAHVDEGVVIDRIPFEWPILDHEISRWPKDRARDPAGWRAWRRHEDQRDFPEPSYGPWKAALIVAADRIADRSPVDLVVATANPNVDFVVGEHLFMTRGVPHVMDYRDAWRLNTFTGETVHDDLSPAAQAESALIATANEVWFVNDSIRDWHRARYPDHAARMLTVMNGFDVEFAPQVRSTAPAHGVPIRFGFVGTVTNTVPLEELIAGWRLARERDALMAVSTMDLFGYLGFYATKTRALSDLVVEASVDGVAYRGPVDKSEIIAAYEVIDVLLMVVGGGTYVTSGKVFEYVASALPIVSVLPPDNSATEVLDGYPLWFPAADLSPESIAEAMTAAADAASHVSDHTRTACAAFAARFERSRQLRPRVEALLHRVRGASS